MALVVVRGRIDVEDGAHHVHVERINRVEVRGAAADAGGVKEVRRGRGADVGLDSGGLGRAEAHLVVGRVGELALEADGRVLTVQLLRSRGAGGACVRGGGHVGELRAAVGGVRAERSAESSHSPTTTIVPGTSIAIEVQSAESASTHVEVR